MGEPFIGSEAVARGDVARSALRAQYTKVFHDVYVRRGTELTPQLRARAGWLWSRRRGIIAGLSAAALHGAKWVDPAAPVEIIHDNRNSLTGLRVRGDRIDDDEVAELYGIPTTTPARTALDLACWYPTGEAVAVIDALSRATDLELADVETLAARYPGRRSIRWARTSLSLVDAGAQSPQETWLRLQLVKVGLPTPQTQIPVRDEFGDVITHLDMGWPSAKVAVEYDDPQHLSDRWQLAQSNRRLELLEQLGWVVVRVAAGEHPADILRRVRAPLAHRAAQLPGGSRRISR
ncbi:MAG TPA: type IV toxin-antitoxin system AbiEi family antitoxin [Mycobacterium sp.]|nr:type IV toxin-antitoxin system AbiEi family antitoxin [Mycobacterium sp.]